MNIFAYRKSPWITMIIIVLLGISCASIFLPAIVGAQSLTDGAPTAVPGTTQQQKEPPITCTWYNWPIHPTCLGKALAVYTSLLFIFLAGKILDIAGVLLNAALELTTIGFDSQIYNRVAPGIESVWTAFRDIANIVIIGMFTFIALTMILGIEKFGAKKMVANVLIIAVLINFSLLFTRVIITSSNFVATQFYKAAQFGVNPASTATALTSFGQYQTGISGKFGQLLGVGSYANTKDGLWKVAEGQDNGFLAAGMGLLTVAVMVAAAFVFFYASFLLMARALLFIFLLITSSLAFASYLIPGGGFGGYGWSSWWSSLLKNAVFGPILLIMLWATMQLGEGIRGINSGGGSLGELFVDPAKGGGINALFSYLLILGMLYASIKIASSFASKIGGFDMAKAFAGTPIALGSRFAGVLGRNLIGRGFAKRSEGLSGDIANTQRRLGSIKPGDVGSEHYKAFLQNRLTNLEQKKKTADRIADRKFSLANTDIGKNILQKQLGAPAMAVGGGKNVASFNETQKKTAEEAAKRAVEVTKLSTKDADMVRRSATDVLQKQKEVLEKNVEVAETNRQSEETSRAADIKAHEDEIVDAQKDHELYRTSMMPGGARDMALNQEKVRIETAQNAINDMRKQFRENAGLDKLSEQLAAIDKSIKDTGDLAVGTARDNLKAAGGELARDIAYGRNTNILPWASGGNPEKDQTARKARDTYNKKVGDAGEEDRILEALKRRMGPGSTPPTTPPTP